MKSLLPKSRLDEVMGIDCPLGSSRKARGDPTLVAPPATCGAPPGKTAVPPGGGAAVLGGGGGGDMY